MAVSILETATKELNQQIGQTADGSQFLTFNLGDELYGVDILRVQEIKSYTTATKISNTCPTINGVLNLRDTLVPIVELRTKVGMPTIEHTVFTAIIIVVVQERVLGLIVDSVSDVLNIDKKDIQPSRPFQTKIDSTFLHGVGESGDKLVALLDMDQLLTDGVLRSRSRVPQPDRQRGKMKLT